MILSNDRKSSFKSFRKLIFTFLLLILTFSVVIKNQNSGYLESFDQKTNLIFESNLDYYPLYNNPNDHNNYKTALSFRLIPITNEVHNVFTSIHFEILRFNEIIHLKVKQIIVLPFCLLPIPPPDLYLS